MLQAHNMLNWATSCSSSFIFKPPWLRCASWREEHSFFTVARSCCKCYCWWTGRKYSISDEVNSVTASPLSVLVEKWCLGTLEIWSSYASSSSFMFLFDYRFFSIHGIKLSKIQERANTYSLQYKPSTICPECSELSIEPNAKVITFSRAQAVLGISISFSWSIFVISENITFFEICHYHHCSQTRRESRWMLKSRY